MYSVVAAGIGALLLVSAASKAAAPSSRSSLAVFGITGTGAQRLAWGAAIVVELTIGALLIAGKRWALLAAAGLFCAFAIMHLLALRRGQTGQPCGCLGNHGTVSWGAVAGNGFLSLFALAAFLGAALDPSVSVLVAIGFAVLTLAVLVLGVAVAALARELGIIRLALQSKGALEIASEGPALGERVELGRWFDTAGRDLALAVFSSPGCPICKNLSPAVGFVARDPKLAVLTFDEVVDRDAWDAFGAPGSPYAVALDTDGTVLAKGVPNSLPELESVVAAALRRRAEVANA